MISNVGRVKSLAREGVLSERMKSQTVNSTGYKCVSLWHSNVTKFVRVHRLIANAFIPNPHELPQINHIDGNKLNNSIDNLEWVTNTGNCEHALKTGLRKLKVSPEDVHMIRMLDGYFTNYELAAMYGLDRSYVGDIVNYDVRKEW